MHCAMRTGLLVLASSLAGLASGCGSPPPEPAPASLAALTVKDPVCGKQVSVENTPKTTFSGRTFRFCSEACLAEFKASPEKYAPTTPPTPVQPIAPKKTDDESGEGGGKGPGGHPHY